MDHHRQASRDGDESKKILSLISEKKMAAHWLPVLMFTLIWGLVGGVAPKFVPRGPHQSLIQVELSLIVGGVAPKIVPRGPHQSLIQVELSLIGGGGWRLSLYPGVHTSHLYR